MAANIQAPKGTKDILPKNSGTWRLVEDVMRDEASIHGFEEIRTPVFERTELFERSVGDTTDVVQKEMYTFSDKGNRSISLRPEGTAGVVRALLEHALINEGVPQKFYYLISCYRYENTQEGRQREFHQFGCEAFGTAAPVADAELIALAHGIFERLGIRNLSLEINSIGCPECRAKYHAALKAFLEASKSELCDTCLERLDKNPMRILDCKTPSCGEITKNAPVMKDYLCQECAEHFAAVQEYLDAAEIEYTVNPRIVRGLDYYTRTVFEFISNDLGAQSTVCGGGRYDGLVKQMGGAQTPALGFAMGMERLLLIMQAQGIQLPESPVCELYIAPLGKQAQIKAFAFTNMLHQASIKAECDMCDRSLKAQMKYADKIGALFTLVLGDDELKHNQAELKNMKTGEKMPISLGDTFLTEFVAAATQAEDMISFNMDELSIDLESFKQFEKE